MDGGSQSPTPLEPALLAKTFSSSQRTVDESSTPSAPGTPTLASATQHGTPTRRSSYSLCTRFCAKRHADTLLTGSTDSILVLESVSQSWRYRERITEHLT